MLKSIIDTVLFCGYQGIAYRGHRDDQTSIENNPDLDCWNFLELLQFHAMLRTLKQQLLAMQPTLVKPYGMISFVCVVR